MTSDNWGVSTEFGAEGDISWISHARVTNPVQLAFVALGDGRQPIPWAPTLRKTRCVSSWNRIILTNLLVQCLFGMINEYGRVWWGTSRIVSRGEVVFPLASPSWEVVREDNSSRGDHSGRRPIQRSIHCNCVIKDRSALINFNTVASYPIFHAFSPFFHWLFPT